jgi:predicted CoA-binding protein
MPEIVSINDVARVLRESRTVAVLGAHPDAAKASYYVPAYLKEHGYEIFPVNPRYAGTTLHGAVVRATLAELPGPVDIVDVFRRTGDLPAHLPELLACRPRLVWFQLGIRNDEVAKALVDAGIDVIQDRCMLADHRRLREPAT